MTELDTKINKVMNGSMKADSGALTFAGNASVINKAEDVINILHRMEIDISQAAFLSIGGADGTEIIEILTKTSSSYGILLEYDDDLCRIANERSKKLREAYKKELQVLTGDAIQKADKAINIAAKWKSEEKINLLIVTIHALLHELPNRGSKITDLEGFLQKFIRNDIPIVFIMREPCFPYDLPEFVYLSADCHPNSIVFIADKIKARHPEFANVPEPLEFHDKVKINSRLAIETVMKLLYVEEINYEINERITSYSDNEYIKSFSVVFGSENIVKYEKIQTDSFNKLWKKYKIKMCDMDLKEILRPQIFVRIVAKHGVEEYIKQKKN